MARERPPSVVGVRRYPGGLCNSLGYARPRLYHLTRIEHSPETVPACHAHSAAPPLSRIGVCDDNLNGAPAPQPGHLADVFAPRLHRHSRATP